MWKNVKSFNNTERAARIQVDELGIKNSLFTMGTAAAATAAAAAAAAAADPGSKMLIMNERIRTAMPLPPRRTLREMWVNCVRYLVSTVGEANDCTTLNMANHERTSLLLKSRSTLARPPQSRNVPSRRHSIDFSMHGYSTRRETRRAATVSQR